MERRHLAGNLTKLELPARRLPAAGGAYGDQGLALP